MSTLTCEGLQQVTLEEFYDPTSQASSGKVGDKDVAFYKSKADITPNPKALCALEIGNDTVMHSYPCFRCGKYIFLRPVIKKG